MAKRWYIVQAYSNFERKVAEDIRQKVAQKKLEDLFDDVIVATDDEHHEVSAGDVAFIPVNTKHWHGARKGKNMTHWSILGNGKTTIVQE